MFIGCFLFLFLNCVFLHPWPYPWVVVLLAAFGCDFLIFSIYSTCCLCFGKLLKMLSYVIYLFFVYLNVFSLMLAVRWALRATLRRFQGLRTLGSNPDLCRGGISFKTSSIFLLLKALKHCIYIQSTCLSQWKIESCTSKLTIICCCLLSISIVCFQDS